MGSPIEKYILLLECCDAIRSLAREYDFLDIFKPTANYRNSPY